MSVVTSGMVNENYTPGDREEAILEVLKEGRDEGVPWGRSNPAYLAERLDERRQYINRSLQSLCDAGWVRKPGKGLYEYVDDPRDEYEPGDQLRGDGAGTIIATADIDQAIEDIVQAWRPGNDLDRREQRRAAGRAVLEFLRDRGVAQAQEFQNEVEPEHPVENQSADTWWEKTARPCLNRAVDAGLVSLDKDNNEWHWSSEA